MSFECQECLKFYSSKNSLNNHLKTNLHKNNISKNSKSNCSEPEDKTFFILKRKCNPDLKTLVDEKVYNHVKEIKGAVCNAKNNYADVRINGIKQSFHRYIYYEIYGYDKYENTRIDHINNDRLDNRIANLREVSYRQNALNKCMKTSKSTSKYYGVSRGSAKGAGGKQLWQCQLRSKTFRYNFLYEKEEHAAYHYDLLVKSHNLEEFSKMNNIKEPDGFVLKKSPPKRDLPKNIHKINKKYYYQYRKHVGKRYLTIEEAQLSLDELKTYLETEKTRRRLNKPINRNKEGIAVIDLLNKQREKVGETMIDDEDYYELLRYKWNMGYGKLYNRVSGTVNGETVILSRFIMKYNGKKMVDHINSNPLDNRKCNLRIIDVIGNGQNKSKSSLSYHSSRYMGVSSDKTRNKWKAGITYNNKEENIGRFSTEKEAAIARDIRAKYLNTHYGCYYKLNFPDL